MVLQRPAGRGYQAPVGFMENGTSSLTPYQQEMDNVRYLGGDAANVVSVVWQLHLDGRPARFVANRTARVRVRRSTGLLL